jgi:hypothetical protein
MRTVLFYHQGDKHLAKDTLKDLESFSPESWDTDNPRCVKVARQIRKQLILDAKDGEVFWFVDPDTVFIKSPQLVVDEFEEHQKDGVFFGCTRFHWNFVCGGCSFLKVNSQVKRVVQRENVNECEDTILSREVKIHTMYRILDVWGLWNLDSYSFLRDEPSRMFEKIQKWWPNVAAVHGDRYGVIRKQLC